jgi:hypothetical protein
VPIGLIIASEGPMGHQATPRPQSGVLGRPCRATSVPGTSRYRYPSGSSVRTYRNPSGPRRTSRMRPSSPSSSRHSPWTLLSPRLRRTTIWPASAPSQTSVSSLACCSVSPEGAIDGTQIWIGASLSRLLIGLTDVLFARSATTIPQARSHNDPHQDPKHGFGRCWCAIVRLGECVA